MRHPITAAVLAALVASGGLAAPRAFAASSRLLHFDAALVDTRAAAPAAPAPFAAHAAPEAGLRLVQFDGRVRQERLDALAARGIVPLQYVADDGYLVWADADAVARLAELRRDASWLAYDAPFQTFLKVDTALAQRIERAVGTGDDVDIVVQVYAHAGDADTRRFVESLGVVPTAQLAPLGPGAVAYAWAPVLKFANLALRVRAADVPAIAARPDVTYVGLRTEAVLFDEQQALILSGDMAPGPAAPSYLAFLLDRGFSRDPTDYALVDITDSTIHEGTSGVTALATADEMLHVDGDIARPSRVEYVENCSTVPDAQLGSMDGHGSINAGILAGYDQRTGYPYVDLDGRHSGLGINPFARIGSTTIFTGSPAAWNVAGCGDTDQGIVRANAANGARISSNSWGYRASASYSDHDQIWDAAVRDVDVETPGNQPMIYVFAAANDGPGLGTVGSPGSGKNVITVGASENLRPFETPADRCQNDGVAAGDDPQSIAGFSSRGPVAGNRVKPDVVAPGTHILGSASVFSGYAGGGVCIQYYPDATPQTEFAASSGTSHSTPAVSGVASLAYWWIERGGAGPYAGTLDEVGGARAPSPALMKAWLVAHPSYLTGMSANDDLPSNDQGYGMPNLADMFGDTRRVLVDQSDTFDAAGEAREYAWGAVDVGKPVRIALAWTDAPGQLGTSPQVNDLDLVVVANGQTYRGNRFSKQWSVPGGERDARNNVEAVFLPPGILGDVTVRVEATNVAGDGVPGTGDATDQDFALVCTNCTRQPSFTLTSEAAGVSVCTGGSNATTFDVTPVVGFASPVTFATSGLPGGVSANVAPNPATPPAQPQLAVNAAASAAPGIYDATLTATSGAIEKTLPLTVGVYAAPPASSSPLAPANGAANVSATPTLTWTAADRAFAYVVQIATDPGFANIVRERETRDTAWTLASGEALDTSARYYWRVIARNACGDSGGDTLFADGFESAAAAAQAFTTLALPGDCPVDATTVAIYADDMESGAAGWTHGAPAGNADRWTLGDVANSGAFAWQAQAPASGSPNRQWLVSPPVALPANLATASLAFWNRQNLKAGGAGVCNDAAIVEVSANGGGTWTQLTGALTQAFDGDVSAAFANPLAGKRAWCGDPRDWGRAVVDASAYAGRTVQFRFTAGHDRFPHRPGANLVVDDVRVTGCTP
ncbi:S8 family serine peptidase [Tahibacter soli]|uniref:S8 family serine peptidase n=1 Tax=Tahibacter soli TaxID=2983605 RepID=A0A9X3YMC7_9GAMM|nr:S8 family serine peptidase [Tahibacter soli]MDC8014947.1 S8 family serine peptidase [Tahibacter soli]